MRHFLLLIAGALPFAFFAQVGVEGISYENIFLNFEDESLFDYVLINPDDSLNSWNIGWTDKFSGDSISAIFTDTAETYANNLHSWFQVRLNDHIIGGPTYVQFELSGSTETGDGMYIEVSYDNGENFENIIFDTIPGEWVGSYTPYDSYLYSEEDTLFNGEPGFSGEIDEFVYLQWQGFCVNQPRNFFNADSMLVRFNFVSDSVASSHPGFAIDNFQMEVALCFNIDEVTSNQFELIQNPVHNSIEIRSLESGISNYSYELYSLQGKLIQSASGIYQKTLRINSQNLSQGNYILMIRDEDKALISRHKIVKN